MIDWTEILKPLQEEMKRSLPYWAAYFLRDMAIGITLIYTALALFTVVLTVLIKKEARLTTNFLRGSILGVLFGGLSCIPNIDRALFLTRIQAVVGIGLIVLVWAFILLIVRPRWIQASSTRSDR